MAIGQKTKISAMAGMVAAYPTFSEISKRAASSYFTPTLFSARTKAVELLAAPTIDRAAMEQVRAGELALAETASKRVTQAIADAAETLQPAQRAKLAEKMKQRMERRG